MNLLCIVAFLNVATAAPLVALDSREYKFTLAEKGFRSVDPLVKATQLWNDISVQALSIPGVTVSGEVSLKKSTPREVYFYDTPGTCLLKANDLQFRIRRKPGDPRKANIKVRNGDRYYAGFHDVSSTNQYCPDPTKCNDKKLEEDIGVAVVDKQFTWKSVFSNSNTRDVVDTKTISTIADLKDLYGQVVPSDIPSNTPLQIVGNLVAIENVYGGTKVTFEASPKCEVEIETSLWYNKNDATRPITAEVSWTLGKPAAGTEAWSSNCIYRIHDLFEKLRADPFASAWLAPKPSTKTEFVYNWQRNWCKKPKDISLF